MTPGGPLTVRADSGFWSAVITADLRQHRIRFPIVVRLRRVRLEADQGDVVPDSRHHAFLTDRGGDAPALVLGHRAKAVTSWGGGY